MNRQFIEKETWIANMIIKNKQTNKKTQELCITINFGITINKQKTKRQQNKTFIFIRIFSGVQDVRNVNLSC